MFERQTTSRMALRRPPYRCLPALDIEQIIAYPRSAGSSQKEKSTSKIFSSPVKNKATSRDAADRGARRGSAAHSHADIDLGDEQRLRRSAPSRLDMRRCNFSPG